MAYTHLGAGGALFTRLLSQHGSGRSPRDTLVSTSPVLSRLVLACNISQRWLGRVGNSHDVDWLGLIRCKAGAFLRNSAETWAAFSWSACMHKETHTHTHTHRYIYIYIYSYIYLFIYIYIYIYTCTNHILHHFHIVFLMSHLNERGCLMEELG